MKPMGFFWITEIWMCFRIRKFEKLMNQIPTWIQNFKIRNVCCNIVTQNCEKFIKLSNLYKILLGTFWNCSIKISQKNQLYKFFKFWLPYWIHNFPWFRKKPGKKWNVRTIVSRLVKGSIIIIIICATNLL